MKNLTKIILCMLFATLFSCQEERTEVLICSSIHGLHNENNNYSFKDLFSTIDKYNPDIIGVEVRQEDIDSSISYLNKFYPFEMYGIIQRYTSKTVVGFDWIGSSIEGKPISENYFKELDALKLQKEADKDSAFQSRLTDLAKLSDIKRNLAVSSTVFELNSGTYDSINTLYYELVDSLYEGTPYQKAADFYRLRDVRISNNIMDIIAKNRGKRLLFVLGADHRGRGVRTFQEKFADDASVRLLEVTND